MSVNKYSYLSVLDDNATDLDNTDRNRTAQFDSTNDALHKLSDEFSICAKKC